MFTSTTTPHCPASMTSYEIAHLTSQHHDHVLNAVGVMLDQLGKSDLDVFHSFIDDDGRLETLAILPDDLAMTLLAGECVALRHHIVSGWMELAALPETTPSPEAEIEKGAHPALVAAGEERKELLSQIG